MNRPLLKTADVVIIGGGVVGVSIAYYLAKKGVRQVLLLERDIMGEGSTGKCAGGIRTQFSTQINIQFSVLSHKVFEGFRTEFGVDPEFCRTGYLFLAAGQPHLKILTDNAQLMQTLDLEVELLEPREIERRWPFLRVNDLAGGSYTARDGYLGPYEVLKGFVRGARGLGAVLRERVAVTAIRMEGRRIQAVETSTGERVKTAIVVNAAGPYAAQVAALAGLELPVYPLRRQIFFTNPFDHLPAIFPLVIDLEHGWYMRREGKGLLLAGPHDSKSSFNQTLDYKAREWTAARSLHRVPVLEHAGIAGGWAGLYDISPDHHAVLGAFPELPGFICANGFSGHGFQHSPVTGMLISELIVEGKTKTLDIHPLRPHRFREKDLIFEPLTAFRD